MDLTARELIELTKEIDQMCIDFAEWISKSGYVKMNDERWYIFKEISFTTLDLLEIYKTNKHNL